MSTPNQSKNTNAFSLQAGISFAVALLTMIFAIFYLPVDPWIRAFLGLGTMFLTTSSFTLAKCVRDAQETAAAVAAARRADRLLAVDLSYRHTAAMQAIRASVAAGSASARPPRQAGRQPATAKRITSLNNVLNSTGAAKARARLSSGRLPGNGLSGLALRMRRTSTETPGDAAADGDEHEPREPG